MNKLVFLFLVVAQFGFSQNYTEVSEDIKVSVYPNPFKDYVSIDSNGYEYDVTLFKLTGEVIRLKYNGNGQIDTKDLASGLYVLKLNLGTTEKTFKLLKE
jgi:hypothetical protein